MDQSEAYSAVRDPLTPAAVIADIAYQYPQMRADVAAHPAAYPGLLDWLDSVGDANVHAAVSARRDADAGQNPSADPDDPLDMTVLQPQEPDIPESSYTPGLSYASEPSAAVEPAYSIPSESDDVQSAQLVPQTFQPVQDYQAPQVGQAPQYQQQPGMPNQVINIGGVMMVQRNGLATASLVLGIISVLFAVIPFVGVFIASPCSLLAFIFGIVGMVRGSRIRLGFGMALTGLLLSIFSDIMIALGGGWLW